MEAKYDHIGKQYNLTRKADPYLLERLHHHLASHAGGHYLDIGCGTGNYTLQLQAKGGGFTGVDPSERMLEKARAKSTTIQWLKGTVEALPLPDACVNGIVGSLTIHHWSDLEQGFKELYRALQPGGQLVIFTAAPAQMRGYWLNHYFPEMLEKSCQQMPRLDRLFTAITQAGFTDLDTEKYFIQKDLQDLFLYSGKHQPDLYLQEAVRQGISSFSTLSNQAEVAAGLLQLEADIQSGEITEIINRYENEDGDYLFVTAKKSIKSSSQML